MQTKKRGQATIFIIIGAIILIAAGITFFVKTSSEREEIVPGVYVSVAEVPTELHPVDNFVKSCLEDVGVRGLRRIGEHGGYISLDDPSLTFQSFAMTADPTEGDAVRFAPSGNLGIPYWYYMEDNNKCEGSCSFSSKAPPLREGQNSIESQLNRFIEREIDSCLNNFESFDLQGFEVLAIEDMNVDTRVTEDDVVIILDYPVEISKDRIEGNLDEFFVRIPVDLQEIYNLATDVTNLQQEYRFLEKQTMNLVSSFSAVDDSKLPPLSDLKFELGSTTNWRKTEVKEKITQMLTSYVPMFQVDVSKNFNQEFYSSPLRQKLYDSMIIPVNEPKYSHLDVTFSYLDFWPIYFDLNCNGENCRPESANSNLLSFIGIQRYNFAYDISFPALVEIYDQDALDGRGFKFNIFLEANVRNNRHMPSEFVPLKSAVIPQFSGLCDEGNKNSGEVSVKVVDSIEKAPLQDVSVALSVGGESCYLGKTDVDGTLTTRFPTGTAGAVVNFLKQDYIGRSELFDAQLDRSTTLETDLDPVTEKRIQVKKKLLEKINNEWVFTNRDMDLDPKETATVMLRRTGPLEEEEYTVASSLTGAEMQQVDIAPGDYELTVYTFLYDDFVIPPQKRRIDTSFFTQEEIDLPGQTFDKDNPFPSGFVQMNISISKKDLENDLMVVHVVSPALQLIPESQRSIEDLEQSMKIDYYSTVYSPLLKPEFK